MSKLDNISSEEKMILDAYDSKLGKVFRLFLPVVTTPIDDIVRKIEGKKVMIYLEELLKRLEKIEIKVGNDQIIKAKLTSLVEYSILKASRCARNSQIKRIADIVSGTNYKERGAFNKAENLINIVSELSEDEAAFGSVP